MGSTAPTEKKAPKSDAARSRTRYVVLQVHGEDVAVIGEGEGLNDTQAIGEVAGALGIEEGSFVAVPTRSWRVRSVSVQTKRSVNVR